MKPLFLSLISFIIWLTACQSPKHSDKKDNDSSLLNVNSAAHASDSTTTVTNPNIDNSDSMAIRKLRARFADVAIPFKGLWVCEHYVDEIRQGKSLRESQDTGTSAIVIPDRTLQVTRLIYGFHEGGEGVVLAKIGSGYYTYSLYDGRCIDTLLILGDERLRIGKYVYIHIGDEGSASADLGVLEQLLFAGQYFSGTATVTFEKNGKIEGLDSLSWYEPVIDYVGYPTNIDHLRLGKDKEHLHDYGFRFAGDSILIYAIDCWQYAGRDCVSDTLGDRMYVLTKIKK